jgi:hypothetical protein
VAKPCGSPRNTPNEELTLLSPCETGNAGLFDVDQKFGGIVEAHAGVEGHHARCSLFVIGAEAVVAAVGRREWGMSLENKIGLT